MSNYRFRVDDGKLVLQVLRPGKSSPYSYEREREAVWDDATVGDIPVADPFRSQPTTNVTMSDGEGYFYNADNGTWGRT